MIGTTTSKSWLSEATTSFASASAAKPVKSRTSVKSTETSSSIPSSVNESERMYSATSLSR